MEKLEILNVSLSKDIPSGNYTIVVDLRNTGSADATISMVYINGKPYDDASFVDKISVRESGGAWISSGSLEVAVGSGSSKTVLTRIVPTFGTMTSPPFTSGTTLDVNIHTAAGKDYQQMVILD
jgi:hypothetical protein